MPVMTLSRAQVEKLHSFCKEHKKDTFFIAKDHGAYVGQSVGATPDKQCLFYFKGCDPKKDYDFYENAVNGFGGDDFGEFLPISWLEKVVERPDIQKMKINVGARSITAKYLLS